MTNGKDFKTIYAGKEVDVDGNTFTVYPISMNQFGRFSEKVVGMIQHLSSVERPEGITEEQMTGLYIRTALPYVLANMMGVVFECITFDGVPLAKREDTDYIPHHVFPGLVTAWLDESFGDEGKVKAWTQALQNLVAYVGKEDSPLLRALSSLSQETE